MTMPNFDQHPTTPAGVQTDDNGDPYMFKIGDMGTFTQKDTGQRNAVTGEPITGRYLTPGTAIFAGGTDASFGLPTLAKGHRAITADDFPPDYPADKVQFRINKGCCVTAQPSKAYNSTHRPRTFLGKTSTRRMIR